jgi:hypothetical protein
MFTPFILLFFVTIGEIFELIFPKNSILRSRIELCLKKHSPDFETTVSVLKEYGLFKK